MEIGDGQILVVLVLTVHVNNLTNDVHRALHVFGGLRRSLHGDTDNDISTHLAGDVGRIVILQSTIHEHLITQSHRRECSGDSHRGTHSLRQPPAVEIVLAVVDDVRSHTGKGNTQILREVERISIARAEMLEQLGQVLALNKAAVVLVPLADGHTRTYNICVLLLAVVKRLVTQVLLVGNHIAPVLHTHHRVERVGVVADSVETADDATHRRTRYDINGNARLLQNFQHTDMSHALRTTATQYDGHLLPSLTDRRAVILLCFHHAAHHRSHQYQYYLLHCGSKFFTSHCSLFTILTSEISSCTLMVSFLYVP